jgi:hypothetical protein
MSMHEGFSKSTRARTLAPDPGFPAHYRAPLQSTPEAAHASVPEGIVAYPDPADDHAWIIFPAEWKGKGLELVDGQGRLALSVKLTLAGLVEVRTADLASGVYQIRVPGASVTGRMIIKH